MKDALIVSFLSLFPRNRGARAMGWFARSGLSRLVTRAFVWVYGVNLEEAARPLSSYRTLEDLFTRRLRPEVRPIDDTPEVLVSPVDGTAAAVGRTEGGRIPLGPPGRTLDVSALIGATESVEYDVAVLYLSPTDYHRVHTPRAGRATHVSYLPGTLWPVFPAAVRRVDDLFSKNERMSVLLDTDAGPLHVVLVGAFGVGRIDLVLGDWVSNEGAPAFRTPLDPSVDLQRGAELGTFHLGSTVVLVSPVGTWTWSVSPGDAVRLGRPLARLDAS